MSFKLTSSHARVTSVKFTKRYGVSQWVSKLVTSIANDRTRVRKKVFLPAHTRGRGRSRQSPQLPRHSQEPSNPAAVARCPPPSASSPRLPHRRRPLEHRQHHWWLGHLPRSGTCKGKIHTQLNFSKLHAHLLRMGGATTPLEGSLKLSWTLPGSLTTLSASLLGSFSLRARFSPTFSLSTKEGRHAVAWKRLGWSRTFAIASWNHKRI